MKQKILLSLFSLINKWENSNTDLEAMEKRSLKSERKTRAPQHKNGQFTKTFMEG